MSWTEAQELVSLVMAKRHLKLPLDVHDEDADLQLKLFIAHEACMHYVAQRVSSASTWATTVDGWTEDTAPKVVLGAILAEFAYLYRRRGDDNDRPPIVEGAAICEDAAALLKRLRDPALA